ncbi:MAG: glycosyl hydrolase [Proteobacteria bacterium]|nr:glycosyl hydrolase [Pseudomonadota bacterium]
MSARAALPALAAVAAVAIGLLVALGLAGCAHRGAADAQGPAVEAWFTTGDQSRLLQRDELPRYFNATTAAAAGTTTIEVDDTRRYQVMAGFGAAITDASAWLIQRRLNQAQRQALLEELFGRGERGIGFDLTRLTIGASDFSPRHYSLDDRPPGETDPELRHFSIEPQRADVLPVVRAARRINPQLQVMASPWSAPAWMKTSGSLIQGRLRPDMQEVFARYLVRYVEAAAAEGVDIFALTLQNEPAFEPEGYPGMRLEAADRAAVIGRHLGPLLAARGLRTQIIEWDHNWDAVQEPLAVLADAEARRHVAGVGWHCYVAESHLPNQSVVHDAHPDKDTWFTECSGGAWKPHWPETLPWMARTLIIGTTRHWARGVLMWNLALDENHGPRLGGCPDCRGMVTIDSATGRVTRNMEFYAFAHASKFVRPGARRIASSEGADGVDNVAFRNADDGSIVLVACNSGAAPRRLTVRHGARAFEVELPRESVASFVWRP